MGEEEEEEGELQLQLHKLSSIKSQETLHYILSTLWNTRKTGLRPPDKSHFQSLLNLPSLSQLHPVLACLRSLIRKFVYQNLSSDGLQKLFPADLPLDLQHLLLQCFNKNGDRWKDEISREQVRTNVPPLDSLLALPSAATSTPLWPCRDNGSLARMNHGDFGAPTPPAAADVNLPGLPACFQCDITLSENLENLPCLKSMTWTMENRGSSPADKVAIISLKLHDYSKSPLGETEVKFQLTKDTFEAMLRSMTYIRDQLSVVGTSSGPANKKQKQ